MTIGLASVLAVLTGGLALLLAFAVIAGAALSLYLLLLALASLRRPRLPKGQGAPAGRFAILIPAYDEELVIGRLLESVNRLAYPRELFSVHVVADHCTDQTAAIARELGAVVHEVSDPEPRGKSHGLNKLVQRLLTSEGRGEIDAFVVLDADSTVSPNFIEAMDLRLRSGSPLVQAVVRIDGAGASPVGQLRALAYELISHLRPLGRSALGLSAGLRGNGMCISRDCAERFPWDAESLTEDYELHARLLAAGLSVSFAPEAEVSTQLPESRSVARRQSERWEKGRLDAARRHVPALLLHGLRRGSWRSIDGAVELMIPPFTIFAGIMLVLVGLSLFSGSAPLIVVAAAGLVALGLYTLRGLSLASARNPRIYRALLHLPGFVAWRLWTYLGMLARRGRVQWTRTDRTPTR